MHPRKKRRFSTASASERGRAEEVNYALQMQTKATLALTRQQPRIRSAEINQAVLCIIIFFFFFFARIIKYLTKQGANQIPSNKIHFVDTKRTMGCWLFQCSLPLIAYEVKKSYWIESLDARLSALLAEIHAALPPVDHALQLTKATLHKCTASRRTSARRSRAPAPLASGASRIRTRRIRSLGSAS